MRSRTVRWLVLAGLLCTLSLVARKMVAQSSTPWPPDASQHKLYMIGNAHIDIPWLWPWPEAMAVGLSTFRAALDRMNEYPDFKFTASSAILYEWVASADSNMIAEIRKRVAEGRWDVVGGWWIEPDVNVPNGESLMRQGLYSQRLFQQLLGRMARVGYNPDSFGHPGTLPQILKLQGMHAYVFMRPGAHEKELPADVFWWQGADGTRVLTYRIPSSYGITRDVQTRMLDFVTKLQEPTKNLMLFYGAGDHGGGPAKETINLILDAQKQPGAPKIIFSTPDRYFDDLLRMDVGASGARPRAERRSALQDSEFPVVEDDLQHHSVGCYTAVSAIKKDNRTAEAALMTGEKMAELANVLMGFPYPKSDFSAAWKKVLLMQFHDSMAGTALPEQYIVSHNAYGFAKEVADQTIYRAAAKIAWQIPTTDPASEYVVVFNPHAWAAKLNVQYDLSWGNDNAEGTQRTSRLEDEKGNAIPHQWTAGQTVAGNRKGLVFQAPVPAFGYRQFRVRRLEPFAAPESTVHAIEKGLENEHLRVTFADDGTISLYDKDAGAEVFRGGAGGARAVVIDDPSDTWSHDVRAYTKEIGAFGSASFRVLENGPVRATLRVRTGYGASFMRTDWLLYAGARTLEARVSLDWHEHQKILKFSFPVDVENPAPTYEIAYGFKVRKANGDEDPGQRWIDLSGERNGKQYGLTVLNDAKYGYSVQASDLRVSIVRGAAYAQHQPRKIDPNGEYIWQDQGIQTFRMVLAPHAGTWQDAGVVRMAEELTAPVPVLYQGIHKGTRPQAASFLSVDVPDVVVSDVKQAEDGNDLIIRCYETAGRATKASLDLELVHRQWTGEFHPLEIKTLRVPLAAAGKIREVNALEQ
jgi:alpha-mannosidase